MLQSSSPAEPSNLCVYQDCLALSQDSEVSKLSVTKRALLRSYKTVEFLYNYAVLGYLLRNRSLYTLKLSTLNCQIPKIYLSSFGDI